jgi:hypothetical protein
MSLIQWTIKLDEQRYGGMLRDTKLTAAQRINMLGGKGQWTSSRCQNTTQ